jgi:hypothetical protein
MSRRGFIPVQQTFWIQRLSQKASFPYPNGFCQVAGYWGKTEWIDSTSEIVKDGVFGTYVS